VPGDLIDVTNVAVTFGNPSTVSGSTVVSNGSTWDAMLTAMRDSEGSPRYGWFLDVKDMAGFNSGEGFSKSLVSMGV